MSLSKKFIADLRAFMKESGMSKTVLGLRVSRDPRAVKDWIEGNRSPRLDAVDRVYAFIDKWRKDNAA